MIHSYDGDWGNNNFWSYEPYNFNPEIEGYEIIKKLGSGTFGIVYKAIDKSNKNEVAIKVEKTSKIYTFALKNLRRFNIGIFNHIKN